MRWPRATGAGIPVRLVKGAYWDTEIKRAQEQGLADYPVFTRKLATDVSYLACARRLLAGGEAFYPQFATHNAQTLASIVELAGDRRDFEFQRLHGMGEALYEELVGDDDGAIACRVYAPVGSHQDLLPYLVRRLLENGANTSFVNRILDDAVPIERLVEDPAGSWRRSTPKRHPRIALPADLYGADRRNSRGIDLRDPEELDALAEQLERGFEPGLQARAGRRWRTRRAASGDRTRPIARRSLGSVIEAGADDVERARPSGAAPPASTWAQAAVAQRAACLERAADLYEAQRAELAGLVRARGRQDPGRCRRRAARGGRLSALLRRGRRARMPGRASCRARPARATAWRCMAAACSSRSAPGTSRSRSSPARSRRRSWSATPWSPSRRRRPR